MPTIIDGSGSATFNTPLPYLQGGTGQAGTVLPVAQGGTGGITGFSNIVQSMVRVNTANGYGSTNITIRRFTNVVTNQGIDITYTDSATLGATFTINTNGVYAIGYSDQFTAASNMVLSLNSTQLSTQGSGINRSDILIYCSTSGASLANIANFTGYLVAGSIIRAHTDGAVTGASTNGTTFTITRVA
jgi:hypothetical protein